jgi:hypothetical protein
MAVHNIVTADGINRGEWPNRELYPHRYLTSTNPLTHSYFILFICFPASCVIPSSSKEYQREIGLDLSQACCGSVMLHEDSSSPASVQPVTNGILWFALIASSPDGVE